MPTKRIAVIGAGPSGLAAIKCCREEGLDVVCYERTDHVGGLWHYNEENERGEGPPSVMRTTVINTCKELSAFSDFPPPKEFPMYLHNTKMLKYFEMYADHFDLYEHIRYHCDVVKVSPSADYDSTGSWEVTVKSEVDDSISVEMFDGIMVCTGHHVYPHIPRFENDEKFQGKIMHSQGVKSGIGFKDQRVLVIGIGNSGADAAVEISSVASQVYLSTRRGAWIVPKKSTKGLPYDAVYNSRLCNFGHKLLGWKLSSSFVERDISHHFDHGLFGLLPDHRFLAQHPSGNEYLQSKLICGAIILKGDVKEFTTNGVIFKDETEITPFDVIILATGYNIVFPFLPGNLAKPLDKGVTLYKYMLSPELKHPSLAFIGLIQPFGPIFPISESQSRWFALMMSGKLKPPKVATMVRHIAKTRKTIEERYVHSARHVTEVDYVEFMDEIAVEYGVKPNLLRYFFTDQPLYWSLLLNPVVAYQYRLYGPHRWSGARKAILEYPKRMIYPLQSRKTPYKYRLYHPYLNGAWVNTLILPFLYLLVFLVFLQAIISELVVSGGSPLISTSGDNSVDAPIVNIEV